MASRRAIIHPILDMQYVHSQPDVFCFKRIMTILRYQGKLRRDGSLLLECLPGILEVLSS